MSDQHNLDVPEDRREDIAEALREMRSGPLPQEMAAIDARVLTIARNKAADIRSRRVTIWRKLWIPSSAAAAALLLLVAHLLVGRSTLPSGGNDIVDVYLLARQLEAGEAPDRSMDMNQDGRVDSTDVEAWASRIVSISGGAS